VRNPGAPPAYGYSALNHEAPLMDFLDPRHLLPLIVIGGSFTFAASVLYGAWLLGRYRGREDQGRAALADVEHRLERLEDVVARATDAVERLEAAHRLTARLLTDRVSDKAGESARPHSASRRPIEAPRTVTPGAGRQSD
jgi:hypothetical protein